MTKTNTKRVSIQGCVNLEGLVGIRDMEEAAGCVSFLYSGDMNRLLQILSAGQITDITVSEPDLEEIFMHYYE